MDSSKLVQFICVYAPPKEVTHHDIVGSCALASFMSVPYFRESDCFTEWLSNDMTKSVRRVSKESTYRKLLDLPLEKESYDFVSQTGTVFYVLVFAPMTYSDAPRVLQRLRVKGFDDCLELPKTMESDSSEVAAMFVVHNDVPLSFNQVLVVATNPHVDMSAGKAGAQAAHAGLLARLALQEEEPERDLRDFVVVADVSADWFFDYERVVVDNGLTETKPGSSTCSYGWEFYSDDDEEEAVEQELTDGYVETGSASGEEGAAV